MPRPRATLTVDPTPPRNGKKKEPVRHFGEMAPREPGQRAISTKRAATARQPNDAAKCERRELLRAMHDAVQQGREPAYTGEPHDNLARNMRMAGCSRDQVSAAFCIKAGTFDNWLQKYPNLRAAWQEGGDVADGLVAYKLWQRAIGYDFEAEKIHVGRYGDVTRVQYTEHVPPDVGAATVWLTNRQMKTWKNRRQNEFTGPDGEPLQVPPITILPVAPAKKEPG